MSDTTRPVESRDQPVKGASIATSRAVASSADKLIPDCHS